MEKYSKIQTVFYRDPETNHKTLLEGEWSVPEFELLKDIDWMWTEKIDGTNIRVIWDGDKVTFKGRTDKAAIPKMLLTTLEELFYPELMKKVFELSPERDPICLYGEGYGDRIQKCGKQYIDGDTDFILFDCKIGDYWLERDMLEGIAHAFDIKAVPIVGMGTLWGAIKKTREGFKSSISEDPDLIAEGLILKPKVGLFNRAHNRIIAKIKHRDFTKDDVQD
jgi:hypothetical protein